MQYFNSSFCLHGVWACPIDSILPISLTVSVSTDNILYANLLEVAYLGSLFQDIRTKKY